MVFTRNLFPLGQVVATRGALQALSEARQGASTFLDLHQEGSWGDVSPEQAAANILALATGERLISRYRTAKDVELWVITEADRSATTVLLPREQ